MCKWNLEILNFLLDEFFIDYRPIFINKQELYFSQNRDNDSEIMNFGKHFSEYIYKKIQTKIEPSIWYENFSRKEVISVLLFTSNRIKLKNYEKLKKPNNRQLFMRFVYSTPSDLYYYFLEKSMNKSE